MFYVILNVISHSKCHTTFRTFQVTFQFTLIRNDIYVILNVISHLKFDISDDIQVTFQVIFKEIFVMIF